MTLMLNHVDSPYIRCIGFLYLRYAADPATLWSWFEPHLHDEEPVQIRQGKADTTVGKFVHMLLNDLEYYGTRLPRLPLAMERQFKVKLLQAERVEERAKQHSANAAAMEYFQKTGARIQALYGDDENPVTWYDAIVDRVILRDSETGDMLVRPKFQVTFPEYGNTEIVSLGEVDLPGSNSDSKSALGAGERGKVGEGGYSRDDGRYDSRGNDSRISNRGHYDDRGNSRYDSRERFHHRERSRSRDREDNFNDARREEQELMEEVLRREREKTTAKGRAYAARPVSFKESIGSSGMESKHLEMDESWRSRGGNRERGDAKKVERDDARDSKPASAPSVPKTAAELAAIEDRKRKLMYRYG
jgi:pre-mRNA-splicing factor 38B